MPSYKAFGPPKRGKKPPKRNNRIIPEPQEVIAPASKAQEIFVNSEADITIASGSAGSSKSYSILLRFIPFIYDPNTTGIIFRRTSGQIQSVGGLWNEAINLYSRIDPGLVIRLKDTELRFSTGARLKFSHFENEASKIKFKGLQASFIAFDEMTEFTEEMVTYLISRLRNVKVKYKPTLCGATNPEYESFLRVWVEWWLDPQTGIPDPAKNGVTRYFVRVNSKMQWADRREELEAIYGTGPDSGITSMKVIGSTCLDNPYLMKADPGYVGRLKVLSQVEVNRLLYGSWYARAEAAGYFKATWCSLVLCPPDRVQRRVRAWDLAGTLPSAANQDPDWTVGVLMSKDKTGRYCIEDVVRFRGRFHEVEQKMHEVAEYDGRDVQIIIPKDPGQAGGAYAFGLVQDFAHKGYYARVKPTNKSKLDRFRPFSAVAEAKLVSVVQADWNRAYFDELEGFDGTGRAKDDQCDATSDAFSALKSSLDIPHFVLPDLSRGSQPNTLQLPVSVQDNHLLPKGFA